MEGTQYMMALSITTEYNNSAFKRKMRDVSNWIPLALMNVKYIKLAANLYPRQSSLAVGLIHR